MILAGSVVPLAAVRGRRHCHAGWLAALLGSAFGIAALASLSLWCAAGMVLARRLKTPRQWRVLNVMLGVLLAASIVPMWRE
ncbi:hypothetical protein [Paraburkholderia saeva]|uniref:hypothetical protein n=1 Tax=Paraburkholderia saeva TaxID=2777537 RepID=UPI001D8FA2CB|nr:hypothetical protein R52603_00922 [Paraburkholderia saeva]